VPELSCGVAIRRLIVPWIVRSIVRRRTRDGIENLVHVSKHVFTENAGFFLNIAANQACACSHQRATRSGGEPVNEAIDGLVTEHGYTDAGDVGPTSDYGHGRRIDFIFTSDGIGVGTPERVQGDSPDKEGEDRDLSDHDGMVVDVEIPVPADGGGDPRV